ncbi:MAG: methyltransferase domain-containing protein [Candidatus Aenigmatarchaeota archaeon]
MIKYQLAKNEKQFKKVSPDHERFIMNYFERKIFPKYKHYEEFIHFTNYLKKREYTYHPHFLRYVNTFGRILEVSTDLGIVLKNKVIVETGTPSIILEYLFIMGNECYFTESDLRIKIDAPSQFADIVLSLEVIEHLKDQPEKSFEDLVNFNFSGVKSYINECARILKPDGLLFLTTPNPCSFKALDNIINYKEPLIYNLHIREYSKTTIIELTKNLMSCIFYDTMFNFFITLEEKYIQIFDNLNWPKDYRGDDQFFVFKKLCL